MQTEKEDGGVGGGRHRVVVTRAADRQDAAVLAVYVDPCYSHVLMSLDLLACDTWLHSSSFSAGESVFTARVVTGIQGSDDDMAFLILLTLHQHRRVLYV